MGRIIRNTISYGFVTLILAALGFCIYLFLDDLDGPEVTMTPDTGRISPTQEITLLSLIHISSSGVGAAASSS